MAEMEPGLPERGRHQGWACGLMWRPTSPVSAFQHRLARAREHLRLFHPGNRGEQDVDGAHCGEAGAAGKAGGGLQVCLQCVRFEGWAQGLRNGTWRKVPEFQSQLCPLLHVNLSVRGFPP